MTHDGLALLREHGHHRPLTGEFDEPTLERQFRATVAAARAPQGPVMALGLVILVALSMIGDLAAYGWGGAWRAAALLRLGSIVPAVILFMGLPRRPALLNRPGLVTAVEAAVLLGALVAGAAAPRPGVVQPLMLGVLGFAVFVLVPNRLSLVTGAVGTAFAAWVTAEAVIRDGPGLSELSAQFVAFAACLATGWAASRILGRAQRDAFLVVEREQAANAELTTEIERRKRVERQMRELIETDPVTGVTTRRSFLERADLELARSRRSREPVALLLVDLDRFKSVNDTWGHATGDRLLHLVATTFSANVRAVDLVGRIGGEEFGVVMPGSDLELALDVAERLRSAVAGLVLEVGGDEVRPTVSVGVTVCDAWTETPLDALGRADEALYRAKAAGRDRVEVG